MGRAATVQHLLYQRSRRRSATHRRLQRICHCGFLFLAAYKLAEWRIYSSLSWTWQRRAEATKNTLHRKVVKGTADVAFPTVEQRVKLYMGAWYLPPCPGNEVVFHYPGDGSNSVVVSMDGRFQDMNVTTIQLQPEIRMATTFYLSRAPLLQCLQDVANKKVMLYCQDIIDTLVPVLGLSNTTNGIFNRDAESVPWMVRFGDMPDSLPIPFLQKFRPVQSVADVATLTSRTCRSTLPLVTLRRSPIIWRLNTDRHYGMLHRVAHVDRPWKDKRSTAVFRGGLTGFRPATAAGLSDYDVCLALPRCRLVYENHHHPLLDVKLTSMLHNGISDTIRGVRLTAPHRMGMKDMLRHKMLIFLEGNDVSSGLKWGLLSQSVVLMPPPTMTSWAMEELLQPWVHYVPLLSDLSDAPQMVQWVLDHDDDARRIAQRATTWMQHLTQGERAAADNAAIEAEIVRRYQQQFRYDAVGPARPWYETFLLWTR